MIDLDELTIVCVNIGNYEDNFDSLKQSLVDTGCHVFTDSCVSGGREIARNYKTHVLDGNFVKKYVLWIDASFKILRPDWLQWLCGHYDNKPLFWKHPERDNMTDELQAAMQVKKFAKYP